ncbi:hypothetical protein AMAG_12873 [Allomyces macrogynus ATCC 38327]|uniref:Uncharacterized protein n=1 Tax=Allomyces macrogynus (strain ATCC 38327) TaxID=578462 RepID=A0A0L0T0B4_ALLM3|nr:hypothetical protein AMAG_12873 [Allomyces macrogynus ATCC 38327]|eukprot:KNE68192.1 hypothetical protein AMAG_12873 [Allomyces macrogynus ATCC 38327]
MTYVVATVEKPTVKVVRRSDCHFPTLPIVRPVVVAAPRPVVVEERVVVTKPRVVVEDVQVVRRASRRAIVTEVAESSEETTVLTADGTVYNKKTASKKTTTRPAVARAVVAGTDRFIAGPEETPFDVRVETDKKRKTTKVAVDQAGAVDVNVKMGKCGSAEVDLSAKPAKAKRGVVYYV